MPELPDIEVYLDCLRPRILGQTLQDIRLQSPFLLRSVEPPLEALVGKSVLDLRRLGKRVVVGLGQDLFLVLHLMIAGRLRWREAGASLPGKRGLAAFDFKTGSLILTEAGSQKRASLYVVRGETALAEHDPGGLEVLQASLAEFGRRLTSRNHTLKRALTDPRLLSGIGNAYSDEILHAAQLSPVRWTQRLSAEEVERLYTAIRTTLPEWVNRLRGRVGDGFPEKVTAFAPGMAVHGRYGQTCPRCTGPVQRIRFASSECNYCPTCQTGGKLLADRGLSRLLGKDWPRTLEEMEERRRGELP